ncbi:Vid27p SCDLUD_003010 [Saccharomycodes ludwigii]|uniref:Vid27p n=1 Tax=Saccharomycodes ludwigii TaxID=36035 RepID=UPI001E857D76|nr:hypothetical protein SCDLUD_003010 [Saccharomycodes ludwigii]KAH3901514.1 hypothetical protein SCDLUD_003010 [Saccharomycodes ludwigii]
MQIKNKELFIALDTSDDDADDDEEEDNDDEEKEEEKEETANQSFSEDMGKNKIIRNFYEPHSKTDSLTVGFKLDRSYVVHRSNISILKNNEEDNELEYVTTISNISDIKDKKHFTPYKPMLYMEDRAMLFQNPSDQTAIYKMDIERGTIVEKWSMGNKALTSFGPAKKYDQLTNEQSFLGVSKKSLFQVDPRINSNNKIVLDATFDYKTNPKFTSLTTSQEGYVSVGSTDGSIRLYDKLGIRAKTLIPGFGDEIKHSVISNDGRWLLATCTDHLILYDLKIYEGKETTDLLAFSKSNSNPKYYYLKLPETIKTQIRSSGESNIIFSRGYFNYGRYAKEDTVVTSTGKFIIFWKLRNICKGIKEPVLLKKYDFDVIEDNFVYGSNNQVVVAFDKGVSMATSRKV